MPDKMKWREKCRKMKKKMGVIRDKWEGERQNVKPEWERQK